MRIGEVTVLQLTFLLVWLGSIMYSVIYYSGLYQEGESLAKVIHLGINGGIFLLLVSFMPKPIFTKVHTVNVLFSLVLLMGVNSIVQLRFDEVTPSLLRFLNYFLIFNFSYFAIKNRGIELFEKSINFFLNLSIFTCLLFGFLEIAMGDIQFLNGAYRLSGSFKFHQLAFGMYLFCVITMVFVLKITSNKVLAKHRLWYMLILALLIFLFVKVHSRMLFISLGASFFVVYFIAYKSAFKRFNMLLFSFILIVVLIVSIFNFGFQPRIKEFLMATKTEKIDSSSKTRLDIIENSTKNLTVIEHISGIGLGRFNKFYEKFTGKDGVAAHNNFLLFLIEGGVISLLYYVSFLGITFYMLSQKLVQTKNITSRKAILVALILFVGIELLGFLLNNYYFYQSEIIVWSFLGVAFSINANKE